jgi:hypothetical protein
LKENVLKKPYGFIYMLVNNINHKVYIGQTIYTFKQRYDYAGKGIERVYNYHMSRKNGGEYYNKHLVNSIEFYGLENFTVYENYDIAYSQDELNEKEEHWIKHYKSYDNKFGYNKNLGGDGQKASKETREKISLNHKDVSGINNPMFGKRGELAPCYGRCGESHPMYGKTGGKHPLAKSIICLNTLEVFPSSVEIYNKYKVNRNSVCMCCRGIHKHSGKHPATKEPLRWMYYDDYKKLNEIDKSNFNKITPYKYICLNTKETFFTAKEASIKYNTFDTTIVQCCKGIKKSSGKHPVTGEKLVWMYYYDYIKLHNDKIN